MGKTSILTKYVKNVFHESTKPTIGVDFANKAVTRDELKSRSTSCDEGSRKPTHSVQEELVL